MELGDFSMSGSGCFTLFLGSQGLQVSITRIMHYKSDTEAEIECLIELIVYSFYLPSGLPPVT